MSESIKIPIILTTFQIDFLLECFFKHNTCIGWRNIATKLITTGKCIVAGKYNIWIGGIGNFISTEESKDAYNCLEYTFDINTFLKSEWFKQVYDASIRELYAEKESITQQYEEMVDLYKQ